MALSLLALSPSSAIEFKFCPQRFKFRVVDRLPEPPSPAAARGSLVHAVLERLLREPAHARTPERAEDILVELWDGGGGDHDRPSIDDARALIRNYFRIEDPRALAATRLEWNVGYEIEDLHLRGVIDRIDEVDGSWVLTDYKTGRIPSEQRELRAFFGLRFYALVCWRAFAVLPREIRLVYLADPAVLTLTPRPAMLESFERQMHALAAAIRKAADSGDWRPRPSPGCPSCSFQPVCPAWAGGG